MARLCSPNWLDTYCSFASHLESPSIYHVWVGLSMIASALERRVVYERKFFDYYPNLYIALVGPTGIAKSTAAELGLKILRQVPQINVLEERLTSYYLLKWFGDLEAAKKDCACLLFASEMRTMMSEINRGELVAMLTSFYGSPDVSHYRTKGEDVLEFHNICINFLGCSTPEWLTTGTTIDEIAGGFTGRFVYVYSDTEARSTPFPEDFWSPEKEQQKQNLVHDLNQISQIRGGITLTSNARKAYQRWYDNRKKEWTDERLMGYFSRKRDTVLKIAILLSVSRDDSLLIDKDEIELSLRILNEVEKSMSLALSGVCDDPTLKFQDMIISQIARAPNQMMSKRDLLRKNHNKFTNETLDRVVRHLDEAHIIKSFPQKGKGMMYKLKDTDLVV